MEQCVYDHGLDARQRQRTRNRGGVAYGFTTRAVYMRGEYWTFYTRTSLDLFERSAHENAHHAYHADTGESSADHPEDFWDDYYWPIRQRADRYCRGI